MPDQPYITLVIPAYNEVKRIAQTIGEARDYFAQRGLTCEIIVSADGDDGTRELVAEMGQRDPMLRVIGSVERRGKGYGIRQGIALARGEIIGFVDADNKTPIDEFEKFKPWLDQGYEVVIGSRGKRESRIEKPQPLYRRLGSMGFALFMHAVIGLNDIVDTQCGFKFFQRAIALDLFRRQQIDGYMYDVEILYLARRAGYRISEVPIRWRDDGDSRLQLLRGNFRNGVDILRLRFINHRQPQLGPNHFVFLPIQLVINAGRFGLNALYQQLNSAFWRLAHQPVVALFVLLIVCRVYTIFKLNVRWNCLSGVAGRSSESTPPRD